MTRSGGGRMISARIPSEAAFHNRRKAATETSEGRYGKNDFGLEAIESGVWQLPAYRYGVLGKEDAEERLDVLLRLFGALKNVIRFGYRSLGDLGLHAELETLDDRGRLGRIRFGPGDGCLGGFKESFHEFRPL